MPDAVDLRRGRRKKVTLVVASEGNTTKRYRPRVAGLSVAKAIQLMRAEKRTPYLQGPFMVRERGEGGPENKYKAVSEKSRMVLREKHILKAWG